MNGKNWIEEQTQMERAAGAETHSWNFSNHQEVTKLVMKGDLARYFTPKPNLTTHRLQQVFKRFGGFVKVVAPARTERTYSWFAAIIFLLRENAITILLSWNGEYATEVRTFAPLSRSDAETFRKVLEDHLHAETEGTFDLGERFFTYI